MKRVTHNNELTDNYHPTLQFLSALWNSIASFTWCGLQWGKKEWQISPYITVFLSEQENISPELVVSVSHLMSSEFRHQDFDNSDEYEEVNLK